jgi:tetraacyldisaccharide 4'-kinase
MDLPLPIRISLLPLSWIYGFAVRCKDRMYSMGWLSQRRLRGVVISVGNLTVGGTGKTPMVLWLAKKYLAEGKRVAILSRGYRGSHGTSDEVELLRRRLGSEVVFGVGADRFERGRQLEEAQPIDVFLLDDGFQHRQLARDVDILMLDGSRDLRKEWLLPAGKLREPIGARRRADFLVITRKLKRPPEEADFKEHRSFYAQTKLIGFRKIGQNTEPSFLSEIGSRPYFAFCGIGNPQSFFEDLESWQVALVGTKQFRDHHHYSQQDSANLEELAKKAGAAALITTEKDEQNLRDANFANLPVYVAVIEFSLSSETEFIPALDRMLADRRNRPS